MTLCGYAKSQLSSMQLSLKYIIYMAYESV